MYRVLCIVLFLSLSEGYGRRKYERRPRKCCEDTNFWFNEYFAKAEGFGQKFAGELNSLDKEYENLCRTVNDKATKVYYGNEFKIITPLQHFEAEHITVKVRHRVILIMAKYMNDPRMFGAIRILPAHVDVNEANWTLHDDKILHITIPYKSKDILESGSCGVVPSDEVFIVREKPLSIEEHLAESPLRLEVKVNDYVMQPTQY